MSEFEAIKTILKILLLGFGATFIILIVLVIQQYKIIELIEKVMEELK